MAGLVVVGFAVVGVRTVLMPAKVGRRTRTISAEQQITDISRRVQETMIAEAVKRAGRRS